MILHLEPLDISVHSIIEIREVRINNYVMDSSAMFIDWYEEAITQLGNITTLEQKLNYYPLPQDDYSYELLLLRAMECVGHYARKDYAKTYELTNLYGLVTHYFENYTKQDRFDSFCRKYWGHMMKKHDDLMLRFYDKELPSIEDEPCDSKLKADLIMDERKSFDDYIDLKAIYLYKDDLLGPIEGRY